MIRARQIIKLAMLTAAALVATGRSHAQKSGTTQPERNALEYRYQIPPSQPLRYSEHRSLLYRSQITVGTGTEGIWGLSDMLGSSTRGITSRLAWGAWFTPTHGIEFGIAAGILPTADWRTSRKGMEYYKPYFRTGAGIDINYMLNLTSYAYRTEQVMPVELVWLAGLSYRRSDDNVFGINTALRLQYNFTANAGIYVEPRLTIFDNKLDNERRNVLRAHLTPAVTAGIAVRFNRRNHNEIHSIYRRDASQAAADTLTLPRLVVKTNLLYGMAAAPNIAVEIPFGGRWSAGVEYVCPWVRNRVAGFTYELMLAQAEARFWLKRNAAMTGHFAGAFAGAGSYDFQYRDKGYQSKELYTAGICYGYVCPLSARIALEFTVGAGYMKTSYREYSPDNGCLVYKSTKSTSFIGPNRAGISVVWRIAKKGGSQ